MDTGIRMGNLRERDRPITVLNLVYLYERSVFGDTIDHTLTVINKLSKSDHEIYIFQQPVSP